MSRAIILSEHAEEDLREIWVYSDARWGEHQADRYLDRLADGIRACGSQPTRGRARDEVRVGYWSRRAQRHVVFYTFDDEQVLVLRVLHCAMEPTFHLDEGDELDPRAGC